MHIIKCGKGSRTSQTWCACMDLDVELPRLTPVCLPPPAVMPKDRYRLMKAYMPTVGTRGLDMMFRTCTIQVRAAGGVPVGAHGVARKDLMYQACMQSKQGVCLRFRA
jgi:hypothetical protein